MLLRRSWALAGTVLFLLCLACPRPALADRWKVNAYSVENFNPIYGDDSMNVAYSHEDAFGFGLGFNADYDVSYNRDPAVQRWMFERDYDRWDARGVDNAHIAFLHTHGGRDANRSYYTMGQRWGGEDTEAGLASTARMRLGNGNLRYLFTAACDTMWQSDISRHWLSALEGTRMVMGFGSSALDTPTYGAYFWQQKAAGNTIGTAWLNASLRTSYKQTPMVLAAGGSLREAVSIRDAERSFTQSPTGHSWFAWKWLTMSSLADTQDKASTVSADGLLRLRSGVAMKSLAWEDGLADLLQAEGSGAVSSRVADGRVCFEYQAPSTSGRNDRLDSAALQGRADGLMRGLAAKYGLDELDLVASFGQYEQIGSLAGEEAPRLDEVLFRYSPSLQGTGLVAPDSEGYLTVAVDPQTGRCNWLEGDLLVEDRTAGGQSREVAADRGQLERQARLAIAAKYGLAAEAVAIDAEVSGVGYDIADGLARPVYYCEFTAGAQLRSSEKIDLD